MEEGRSQTWASVPEEDLLENRKCREGGLSAVGQVLSSVKGTGCWLQCPWVAGGDSPRLQLGLLRSPVLRVPGVIGLLNELWEGRGDMDFALRIVKYQEPQNRWSNVIFSFYWQKIRTGIKGVTQRYMVTWRLELGLEPGSFMKENLRCLWGHEWENREYY